MINKEPLFPGDDFIDQLDRINDILGKFPNCYKKLIEENDNFHNINFKRYFYKKEPSLKYFELKFLPLCKNSNLINLVKKLLELDFTKRITATEALRHPFFISKADKLLVSPKIKKRMRKRSKPILATINYSSLNMKTNEGFRNHLSIKRKKTKKLKKTKKTKENRKKKTIFPKIKRTTYQHDPIKRVYIQKRNKYSFFNTKNLKKII